MRGPIELPDIDSMVAWRVMMRSDRVWLRGLCVATVVLTVAKFFLPAPWAAYLPTWQMYFGMLCGYVSAVRSRLSVLKHAGFESTWRDLTTPRGCQAYLMDLVRRDAKRYGFTPEMVKEVKEALQQVRTDGDGDGRDRRH